MNSMQHRILSLIWIPAFLFFLAPQMQAQSVYRRGSTAPQQRLEREKQSSGPQKKENIRKNDGRQSDRTHNMTVRPGEKPGNNRYGENRYRPREGRYDNGRNYPDRRKVGSRYRPPRAHAPVPPPPHRPVTRPDIYHYGHRVPALPHGALIIHRGPYHYYYAAGRYYRPYGNAFIICRPPVGAVIAANVLASAVRLTGLIMRDAYGVSRKYYTDGDGVYYVRSGGNYIVVEPPVGAIVYELPYGWQETVMNGITYYRVDNHYYELILNPDGSYCYRVAGRLGR